MADDEWNAYVGRLSHHQGEGLFLLLGRLRGNADYQLAYTLWTNLASDQHVLELLKRALAAVGSAR